MSEKGELKGELNSELNNEERKAFHKKYLKSKQFKVVREYVLGRDGNKCMVCGRTEEDNTKLTCHHRTYRNLGKANHDEIDDCVTLCQICHVAHHRQPINKWWYNIENPRNKPS